MPQSRAKSGEGRYDPKKPGPKFLRDLRGRFSRAWGKVLPLLKENALGIIRIFLLVTLTVVCGIWANRTLEDVRCEYDFDPERCEKVQEGRQGTEDGRQENEESQKEASTSSAGEAENTTLGSPSSGNGGSVHILLASPARDDANDPAAAARAASKNTADLILKQSEQFQSWSVLILTGTIAIVITTKVHRTPGAQWAYLALGPAAIFLVIALHAGWVLAKRYTFLISGDDFSDWPSVANLLQVQSDLFMYAIVCVSLFAGWFLLLIVMGKVVTYETKS